MMISGIGYTSVWENDTKYFQLVYVYDDGKRELSYRRFALVGNAIMDAAEYSSKSGCSYLGETYI
ncbi:hypothetical protein AN220_00710 [Streptomyces nanshensis]|nr:hypothetical protein AN220_00710 [Streptomyces nanshensis]